MTPTAAIVPLDTAAQEMLTFQILPGDLSATHVLGSTGLSQGLLSAQLRDKGSGCLSLGAGRKHRMMLMGCPPLREPGHRTVQRQCWAQGKAGAALGAAEGMVRAV